MNADEIVDEDPTKAADANNLPEPTVSDLAQPQPRKSRFAELLKAIEHWVQTR